MSHTLTMATGPALELLLVAGFPSGRTDPASLHSDIWLIPSVRESEHFLFESQDIQYQGAVMPAANEIGVFCEVSLAETI